MTPTLFQSERRLRYLLKPLNFLARRVKPRVDISAPSSELIRKVFNVNALLSRRFDLSDD